MLQYNNTKYCFLGYMFASYSNNMHNLFLYHSLNVIIPTLLIVIHNASSILEHRDLVYCENAVQGLLYSKE